jgi:hypothetical protein
MSRDSKKAHQIHLVLVLYLSQYKKDLQERVYVSMQH